MGAAAQAQESPSKPLPSNQLKAPFFFDSKQTSFNRDGKRQSLDGDVVFISNGVLIAADHVSLDQDRGLIEASGHIVVLGQNQVLTGERMTYQLKTGDFQVHEAILTLNGQDRAEDVQRRALGFTREELAAETDRTVKIMENEKSKRLMREKYRSLRRQGQEPPELFYDQYAVLLEQGEKIANQENPILARMNEERRASLKKRREFWKSSRSTLGSAEGMSSLNYFQLSGETIVKTDGNDFLSESAVWTPCFCEEGETPDWGFRSDHIEAQQGGYADFHHAIIEVKGIPILYLPYIKVPIKDRRQSGLLIPTIGEDRRNKSGVIYSQAAFFDLGADRDATVTVDNFENRGTRLGSEFRVQKTKLTGWTLNIEGIRDRVWMRERALHDDLGDMYRLGLDSARRDVSPGGSHVEVGPGIGEFVNELKRRSYWEGDPDLARCLDKDPSKAAACERKQLSSFEVPNNSWRGAASWKGVSFIASRLSLVSHGSFISDHRYSSELYVPRDVQAALFGSQFANTYSPAKARVHLDGREIYASVGTSFADNVLANERFKGAQMPGFVVAQSRMVNLDPTGRLIVPVYGQVSGESKRILDYLRREDLDSDEESGQTYLGSGVWDRGHFKLVAPIFSDSVVQVDYFSDFESRQIQHNELARKSSSIRSWRSGFRFQLPIDGKSVLPDSMQPDADEAGIAHTRYLQHVMNWSMTLATRPAVVRRGPYGEKGDLGSNDTTYFVSDQKGGADDGTTAEKIMAENQRVSFSTSHSWRTFDRGWQLIPGVVKGPELVKPQTGNESEDPDPTPKPLEKPPEETSLERARRELIFSLDRQVTDAKELMIGDKILVNRYELKESNSKEHVRASAGIGYDFLKAKRRRELFSELDQPANASRSPQDLSGSIGDPDKEDFRPWDPLGTSLGVNAFGFSLSNSMTYNIYDRIPTELNFALGIPTVLQISSSLSYEIATAIVRKVGEETVLNRSRTRGAAISTSLIPKITTAVVLNSRTQDANDGLPEYRTALSLLYAPNSKCWQLQFARAKEYGSDEHDASYILQLNVLFFGQGRALPDFSPQMTRELRPNET